MKTFFSILTLGLIVAAFIAGMFYAVYKSPSPAVPQQVTLEKIISIKELHLVKHTYNDLFFLHKHNNPAKPIRALVQVPVVVTAYLDLKEIRFVKRGDTLRQVVLPRAKLNQPQYEVNNMIVRETRNIQVHVGRDLYPLMGEYLQQCIAQRMDTVRHLAVSNRVLAQAEEEGKEYVLKLLAELGRSDIEVLFADEAVHGEVNPMRHTVRAGVDAIAFGFLPLW